MSTCLVTTFYSYSPSRPLRLIDYECPVIDWVIEAIRGAQQDPKPQYDPYPVRRSEGPLPMGV